MDNFLEWLQSEGLRKETAQAVINNLGIENQKVIRACIESDSLQTELLSLAKEKFPFAMYADFCKFVKSFLKPQVVQLAGSSLLGSLFVNLETVIRELCSFCQKFPLMHSPLTCFGSQNMHLENVHGFCGIGLSDECTLHLHDDPLKPKSGDLEERANFQIDAPQNLWNTSVLIKETDDDASTQESSSASPLVDTGEDDPINMEYSQHNNDSCISEALKYVSVKEESEDVHLPHGSTSCSDTEQSRSNIGQIRPRSSLGLKMGFFKQQSQEHSLPLKYECISGPHNTKLNVKLNKQKQVLKREMDYKCDMCRMEFATPKNVKIHMRIHTGECSYKCSICGKNFISKQRLNRHSTTHTGERPHKCSVCDKAFSDKRSLKKHLKIHLGVRPHKCSICDKAFIYKHRLITHSTIHTGGRAHKCSVCDKGFSQKCELKMHMRIHTGERPYKCSICDKNFTSKQRLNRHSITHTGERPHKCSVCDKAFPTKYDLTMHMKKHTGEGLYKCSICDKDFIFKHSLIIHSTIHTGEHRHKCSVCDKTFSQKGILKVHMRTHTGERPFKCSVCGKDFSKKVRLKEHIRIHTGERPCKCSVCGKAFTRESGLKMHMMIHTGVRPYKCSVCDKGFISKQKLNFHGITHTRERPHKCSICDESFSQKGSLKKHMRIHTTKRRTPQIPRNRKRSPGTTQKDA
uniref:C2H2-type domain-containing protein n=1 Tax=Eptatretus burgeri TaxID=7764 RepID=A0A8C4QPY9_EPTBU